jgi:hypothetical protein
MSIEQDLFASMTPLIANLAEDGNGAVSLGGSRAKQRSDAQSDFDFRVYSDRYKGPVLQQTSAWRQFDAALQSWETRGLRLDGVWARSYAGVQADLDAWIAGKGQTKTYEWTIWGYHLPTDLAHQQIIVDPNGILAHWKEQLAVYPDALRTSLISQHLEVLRYWASDYHYASKVARRDLVFLVGLTGKLANAILQVVFAVNRTYYPGDGWNLAIAKDLARLPPDFIARMTAILEPGHDTESWQRQRHALIEVIADLEVLTAD